MIRRGTPRGADLPPRASVRVWRAGSLARAAATASVCAVLVAASPSPDAAITIRSGRTAVDASLAEAQAAIDAGNRRYVSALVDKDASAFGALFADDAVSMPSHASLVHGRDAIVASIAGVFKQMTFEHGTLRTIETHLAGQTAYEIGSYDFDVVVERNERELRGRYLVVWRRIDGIWKIAVDSSQPDAPAS